jgi:phosphohistidine swiveling domain-containing protein
MEIKLLKPEELEKYQEEIGAKALKLLELQKIGLCVPDFRVIPASITVKIHQAEKLLDELILKITTDFPQKLYAVRSAAIAEDDKKESLAGQYQTKIAVSPKDLRAAVLEVLTQAKTYQKGNLANFSIIIQEYVEPNVSGVTFSRNPAGSREMLINYHRGRGEDLVSGKIAPMEKSLYWNTSTDRFFRESAELFESCKKIELHFGFPQDIEWCIKRNKLYFLQSRPITTISQDKYEESLFLDQILPKDKFFLYAKTEISEIAERPADFTLDILKKIYAPKGPVHLVYRKNGITYQALDFLKIIGNELFIDREIEIQTLLPALSFENSRLAPKYSHLSKTWLTMKNSFGLNKIWTQSYPKLYSKIRDKLAATNSNSLRENIDKFLEEYALIFEINLLASVATRQLQTALKNEPIDFLSVLRHDFSTLIPKEIDLDLYPPKNLVGNSLQISDESKFVFNAYKKTNVADASAWWEKVPSWKKIYYGQLIAPAIALNRIREFGRWQIVSRNSSIRKALFAQAKKDGFSDDRTIYFAKIDEILSDNISKSRCLERQKKYHEHDKFHLPSSLSSMIVKENHSATFGVSQGKAVGKLVSEEILKSDLVDDNLILYTETLSPDLAQYFPRLKGILSKTGGTLSHLAIIAREKKIPVIVNFRIENQEFMLGDKVEIDGSNGKISKP